MIGPYERSESTVQSMPRDPKSFRSISPAPLDREATVDLLSRYKGGDEVALERLLERCIPPLRRWAHGRLPLPARGMLETMDLVQEAIISTMRRIDLFEARHQGALLGFFRKAIANRIIDLARYHQRRPDQTEVSGDLPDCRPSPLDQAIGTQNVTRYDAALERLERAEREAIICRLELQYSYEEMAVALNKPSAAAARMAVTRAMKRLGELLTAEIESGAGRRPWPGGRKLRQ
jgi:RNA polymerase sigma-70 factor (ECF subfamily)